MYEYVRCADGGNDNEDNSALTFLSEPGMYRGIIYIMSKNLISEQSWNLEV